MNKIWITIRKWKLLKSWCDVVSFCTAGQSLASWAYLFAESHLLKKIGCWRVILGYYCSSAKEGSGNWLLLFQLLWTKWEWQALGKETWFQALGALSWERSRNNWCLPVKYSLGWTCVVGNLWLNNMIDFSQNFFSQRIKISAVNKIDLQWRQQHRPLLSRDNFLHKFSWQVARVISVVPGLSFTGTRLFTEVKVGTQSSFVMQRCVVH